MGMATSCFEKQRPANSHKLWWCEDCGAQFSENKGQWMKAWSWSSMGSSTVQHDRVQKAHDIPSGVCVGCESKNVHGPIDK